MPSQLLPETVEIKVSLVEETSNQDFTKDKECSYRKVGQN